MLRRFRGCSETEALELVCENPVHVFGRGFSFAPSTAVSLCLALVIVSLWPQAGAARVISAAVSSIDDIPPAPPSHIQAADRPDDGGGHIVVTWVLSPDDRIVFIASGSGSIVTAAGPAPVFRQRGISGYRIYRLPEGGVAALLEEVAAGIDRFVDDSAPDNATLRYEVRSFDDAHETAPELVPGSPEDLARTAVAIDNFTQPVDESGQVVQGWFNRADNKVGLDDFFLFVDRFGRIEGEISFDSRFDLNGDTRIDFDDFFIFSDNFGKTVANFDELSGESG